MAATVALPLIMAVISAMMPAGALARPACTFTLGFETLHSLIPDIVGECETVEQIDPMTGNITQRTTTGSLTWRKADNWTAFSDGPNTYILRPEGVVSRPTVGPLLPWELPQPNTTSPAERRQPRAPSSVLFAETFDDIGSTMCVSLDGMTPVDFTSQCSDNGLRIAGVLPRQRTMSLNLPGAYGNASVALDAQVVDGSEQRIIALTCRSRSSPGPSGYFFFIEPALQRFSFGRAVSGKWQTVIGPQESAAINSGGKANRMELVCSEDMITGLVNGIEVGSFHDDAYRSGRFTLSVEHTAEVPLSIDARFDNLVIQER